MAKSKKTKMPEPANTFGTRVKAIRGRLKMYQVDMAPGLGISTTRLSEIENDKSKPCHDFFYNIVKNFHVNLYYLLFGEGEMFLEPLSIGGGLSRYSGSNPEMKRFIWYFERSPILQHFILGQFRRYMMDEKETIDRDVNIFVNESDKDIYRFKEGDKERK